MDTHVRPYFFSSTTQLEVDSALFSRALENNDPQVMKKDLCGYGYSADGDLWPMVCTSYSRSNSSVVTRSSGFRPCLSVLSPSRTPEQSVGPFLVRRYGLSEISIRAVFNNLLHTGVPFLLRVGIAIMQCCRRSILEATNDSALLQLLRRPPSKPTAPICRRLPHARVRRQVER